MDPRRDGGRKENQYGITLRKHEYYITVKERNCYNKSCVQELTISYSYNILLTRFITVYAGIRTSKCGKDSLLDGNSS